MKKSSIEKAVKTLKRFFICSHPFTVYYTDEGRKFEGADAGRGRFLCE
jgi:hypothetical protein